MNKKGFTIVELLTVISILAIISSIAVVSYNAIVENTKTKSYENYELTMKSGAMMYVMDNGYPFGGRITLTTLLNDNRVNYFNNPNSDDKCLSSYVDVIKDENDSSNLSYKICLICPEYKSEGC